MFQTYPEELRIMPSCGNGERLQLASVLRDELPDDGPLGGRVALADRDPDVLRAGGEQLEVGDLQRRRL